MSGVMPALTGVESTGRDALKAIRRAVDDQGLTITLIAVRSFIAR